MTIFWRCIRGIICAPLLLVFFVLFTLVWALKYDGVIERICDCGFTVCEFVGSGAPIFYDQITSHTRQKFLSLGFIAFVFIRSDLKENNWFIGYVLKGSCNFEGFWF